MWGEARPGGALPGEALPGDALPGNALPDAAYRMGRTGPREFDLRRAKVITARRARTGTLTPQWGTFVSSEPGVKRSDSPFSRVTPSAHFLSRRCTRSGHSGAAPPIAYRSTSLKAQVSRADARLLAI